MTVKTWHHAECLAAWAKSFVYSGLTALLLLVVHHYPSCWYFSSVALLPFLWRAACADTAETVRLAVLLGMTYLTFSLIDIMAISPVTFLLRTVAGTTLFALFGYTLARLRCRYGFHPIIVAVLWVVFELVLIKTYYPDGLLTGAGMRVPVGFKLAAVFGFLFVSFLVVLLNSILLLYLREVADILDRCRPAAGSSESSSSFSFDTSHYPQATWYFLPLKRGPPLLQTL